MFLLPNQELLWAKRESSSVCHFISLPVAGPQVLLAYETPHPLTLPISLSSSEALVLHKEQRTFFQAFSSSRHYSPYPYDSPTSTLMPPGIPAATYFEDKCDPAYTLGEGTSLR